MVVPERTKDSIQETFKNIEFRAVDELYTDFSLDFIEDAAI